MRKGGSLIIGSTWGGINTYLRRHFSVTVINVIFWQLVEGEGGGGWQEKYLVVYLKMQSIRSGDGSG